MKQKKETDAKNSPEKILPLSVGKIADLCNLDRTTIFRWIKRGRLIPWMTKGNHFRVNPDDFIKFIKEFNTQIERPIPHKKEMKALCIDNSDQMQNQYKNIIENLWDNFTISQAKSGFEGIVELGRQKPDFVFLELDLPKFDGFSVAKHIREDPETKDVIIIAISHILTNQNIFKINQLGINGYVKKPINLLSFIKTINSVYQSNSNSNFKFGNF